MVCLVSGRVIFSARPDYSAGSVRPFGLRFEHMMSRRSVFYIGHAILNKSETQRDLYRRSRRCSECGL